MEIICKYNYALGSRPIFWKKKNKNMDLPLYHAPTMHLQKKRDHISVIHWLAATGCSQYLFSMN